MKEKLRLKLKSLLPSEFNITDATDYPDTSFCKVRGMIREWAVLIEWLYEENPDVLILTATSIDNRIQQGPCLISNLKLALEGLS